MASRKRNRQRHRHVQHKRREKKRKAQFGGLAAFAYTSDKGRPRKQLSAGMGRFH